MNDAKINTPSKPNNLESCINKYISNSENVQPPYYQGSVLVLDHVYQ